MVGECFDKTSRGDERCQLFRVHFIDGRSSLDINYTVENINYFGLFETVLDVNSYVDHNYDSDYENDYESKKVEEGGEKEIITYLFKMLNEGDILKLMFFQFENVIESIFNYIVNHNKKIKKHYNKSYFKSEIKQFYLINK